MSEQLPQLLSMIMMLIMMDVLNEMGIAVASKDDLYAHRHKQTETDKTQKIDHTDLENIQPDQHNDTKVRSKEVDESNIGDDRILVYKVASDKLVYEDKPAGGGDMYKSTYDTDNDGIVDNAEKLEGQTLAQVRDHDPKAHTLSSHSTRDHSELTNIGEDDHHPRLHGDADHTETYLKTETDPTVDGKIAAHSELPDVHHTKFTIIEHNAISGNPHNTTKSDIGLGNVTNDAQLKRANGDINSFNLKTTPANTDILLIEDSADEFAKKKITIGSLPTGGGAHASTHEADGTDKVHFADLEHDEGDTTLHDAFTSAPHISQTEKNKIHDRQHALNSADDHTGTITDTQHGSRGSGLHADSHARQHALDSSPDHTGSITDSQHGNRGSGLHADSHAKLHQASHQSGGEDALGGNLDAVAKVTVRRNTGNDIGSRRRLNFIEGSNVTLTVTDDPANEEVDVTIAAAGAGVETRDLSYYRRVGTVAPECWYTAPNTGTALTTGAPTANVLRAIPFIAPKQVTLDRIAINVTTAAAGQMRLGIYEDNGNLYPSTLVVDAGTVDTGTTGVKALTINVTLNANKLYWLVAVGNAAPTIRTFAVGSMIPILGYGPTLPTAPNFGYSVSFTFASLPATFPTGASVITAVPIPAIFVRLSA